MPKDKYTMKIVVSKNYIKYTHIKDDNKRLRSRMEVYAHLFDSISFESIPKIGHPTATSTTLKFHHRTIHCFKDGGRTFDSTIKTKI